MALGINPSIANTMLSTAFPAAPWMQLHTGDPGLIDAAPAVETRRMKVTFAPPAGGKLINSGANGAVVWTNVAAAETYSNFSLWTAQNGGTFLWSGTLTANPVQAGDTFTIAAGALTMQLIPAG